VRGGDRTLTWLPRQRFRAARFSFSTSRRERAQSPIEVGRILPVSGFGSNTSGQRDGAVVIAVAAAWMMQMPIDQIVMMVGMGHHVMTAALSVFVFFVVTAAGMFGSACGLVRVF